MTGRFLCRLYRPSKSPSFLLIICLLLFNKCYAQSLTPYPTPAPTYEPTAESTPLANDTSTPSPTVTPFPTATPVPSFPSMGSQTPAAFDTLSPSIMWSETNAPTLSPKPSLISSPAPSTALSGSAAPTPLSSSTTAPSSEPPAVANASDSPSSTPSVGSSATQPPSTLEPSLQPSLLLEPTPAPTTTTTTTTTTQPTPMPSPLPSPPPSQPPTPTQAPTTSGGGGGGGIPITASLKDVQTFYNGVGNLSTVAIQKALAATEIWFAESYNNKTFTKISRTRKNRRRRRMRFLQGNDQNPSLIGVQKMETTLKFVSAHFDKTQGGLLLTYDQNLRWKMDSSSSSWTAAELAALPYEYAPTNEKYVTILTTTVPGFENLTGPVAVPDIPLTPTAAPAPAPTPSGGGASSLSGGAIAGIVIGAVIGIPLLIYVVYLLVQAGKDKDSSPSAAGSSGYVSAGSAPPSKVLTAKDEVSTMDYPKIDERESMGDYQDQSVATVDYDYSKAYGGGGDTSVVSSAGGTMGDNTRQTAGDVATTAAARAALGASFDSEGGFREEEHSHIKEEIIEIDAPAGKLGVVIDTPDDGAPVVHAVKDSSVIADQICVGDKLIAVDDEDVRSMTAIKVSKLISKKSANPSRKLTIVRTTYLDDSEG